MSQTLKSSFFDNNEFQLRNSHRNFDTLPAYYNNFNLNLNNKKYRSRIPVSSVNFIDPLEFKQDQIVPVHQNDTTNNRTKTLGNRFYSLRKILTTNKNATCNNNIMKSSTLPKNIDTIQIASLPETKTTKRKTSKVMSLLKGYKNVLTRIQKRFSFNNDDVKRNVVSVDVQTQTQSNITTSDIEEEEDEDDDEYDFLNDYRSSSVISDNVQLNIIRINMNSSSSSCSSSSSSFSSLSFNPSKISTGIASCSEYENDLLCDLEVASIFNRSAASSTRSNQHEPILSKQIYDNQTQQLYPKNYAYKKTSFILPSFNSNRNVNKNFMDFGTLC